MTLPNADDPRGGTPMNTDDERQKYWYPTIAKIGKQYRKAVVEHDRDGEINRVQDLMNEVAALLHKSNLQRAIDELENVKANHPIVSGFHADCKLCSWIDDRIAELRAELQQVEKEGTL